MNYYLSTAPLTELLFTAKYDANLTNPRTLLSYNEDGNVIISLCLLQIKINSFLI